MRQPIWQARFLRLALVPVLFVLASFSCGAERHGNRVCGIQCDPCAIPCNTRFAAQCEGENLQVLVVGKNFDSLEIYFKLTEEKQNFRVEEGLLGARNLHLNGSLKLAPASPFGCFGVRYGQNQDTFKLYGWKKDATDIAVYGPLTLEPGYPVCIHWLTSRIVKLTYGREGDKAKVIMFDPDSGTWNSTWPPVPASGQ